MPATSSRLCSSDLPNPKPGSTHTSATPAEWAVAARRSEEVVHLRSSVDVGGVVLHGARLALHVHRHPSHTQIGGDLPQRGAHIVDDGGTGRDRGPGNLGATGVDGDAGAEAVEGGDRLDHGDHTGQLLIDRHRGSARSGRLATHVDEGRTLVHKAARLVTAALRST